MAHTLSLTHHRPARRDYSDTPVIMLYLIGMTILSIGTALVYMYSASIAS